MRQHTMTSPGDGLIVGLSGGADSVCLLYVMKRLSASLGIRLRAIHVHHGLRGAEADRDAAFAETLCRDLAVPFRLVRADAAGEARRLGLSVEEAGRRIRYEAFEQEAKDWEKESGYSQREERGSSETKAPARVWIATAHHQEDSAETILFHLFRGSGLKGLGGIAPVRDRIVRPLLWADRKEIETYLRDNGISWVEDSTNGEDHYSRNRIRNHLLPMAAEEINSEAVPHILQAGEWIGQADAYLERQAKRWLEQERQAKRWLEQERQTERRPEQQTERQPDRCRQEALPAGVDLQALASQEAPLPGYIVRCLLKEKGYPLRDITASHIHAVLSLAESGTGKRVNLPGGITAENEYGKLRLYRENDLSGCADSGTLCGENGSRAGDGGSEEAKFLRLDGGISILHPSDFYLKAELFPCKNPVDFPQNRCTKWFDYDKIKHNLSVRFRRSGDYITLPGGGKKLLKSYMIDEKIPRRLRGEIPLLAEGSHILWIMGRRISEYYKVTGDTKRILQVQTDESFGFCTAETNE